MPLVCPRTSDLSLLWKEESMTGHGSARFLVLYGTPTDPVAFDRHYHQVHVPLAWRLPRLRRYTLSQGAHAIRGESSYLVAELEWDSLEDLRAAFASPEGRATAEDVKVLESLAEVRSMTYLAEPAR